MAVHVMLSGPTLRAHCACGANLEFALSDIVTTYDRESTPRAYIICPSCMTPCWIDVREALYEAHRRRRGAG